MEGMSSHAAYYYYPLSLDGVRAYMHTTTISSTWAHLHLGYHSCTHPATEDIRRWIQGCTAGDNRAYHKRIRYIVVRGLTIGG